MKKFKNTSEIEPYDGIIGQQRAEKAMPESRPAHESGTAQTLGHRLQL